MPNRLLVIMKNSRIVYLKGENLISSFNMNMIAQLYKTAFIF